MSYFLDSTSQLALYEAPKNGGTTVRLWLAYRLTGRLYLSHPNASYYAGTPAMTALLRQAGYRHQAFAPLDCERKICIKRDPVQRFVSCYQDKIIKERGYAITITEFLDRFEEVLASETSVLEIYGMTELRFHFQPQTFHFGEDPTYYDQIFSMAEIGTNLKRYLEDLWTLKLPALHARDAGAINRDEQISERDRERIHELYQVDYANGWF
jgi:hypothetical protein